MGTRDILADSREREEVEKLDLLLSADGELFQSWLNSSPPKESLASKTYRLSYTDWPSRLQSQWRDLMAYKTSNPKELPRDNKTRWSESTIKGFKGVLKEFMGFVSTNTQVQSDQLSLLLLCEWTLVKAFLEFKRQRNSRDYFTHADEMFVRHYRSLLKAYMSFLWKEAEQDGYWKDKLPNFATVEIQIAPGIQRKQEFEVHGPEERWAAVVAEAVKKSERFSQSESFVKGAYVKLAQPFLNSKKALSEVATILGGEVNKLPEKIEDKKLALRCRALATASLLAVRAFRKGTVERLRTEHVHIAAGKVALNIASSIVKNRKPIEGPLPDVAWLHRVFTLYTEQARPLLLLGADSGFWFTTFGGGGKRASHNVLYNDIRQVLGVNPHGMRYVLATDGKRQPSLG